MDWSDYSINRQANWWPWLGLVRLLTISYTLVGEAWSWSCSIWNNLARRTWSNTLLFFLGFFCWISSIIMYLLFNRQKYIWWHLPTEDLVCNTPMNFLWKCCSISWWHHWYFTFFSEWCSGINWELYPFASEVSIFRISMRQVRSF